jgi:hypothetical protein
MNGIIKRVVGVVAVACCLVAAWAAREAAPPEMKFNDVKEIAPGVFFRYSSISATDMSVPFGGCNNTWVVFKEFVVVIDANFPKEAEDVIAAIRKTTDKPIRYVFDTHHHGDHAYGNTVWAKAGAKVIGHVNCSRLLEMNGPKTLPTTSSKQWTLPSMRNMSSTTAASGLSFFIWAMPTPRAMLLPISQSTNYCARVMRA